MCETDDFVQLLQRVYDRRCVDRESIGFCYFDRHPQKSKGEVFVCNACEKEFQKMELKTKRLGGLAFTFRGEQFPESRRLFSVFAQQSELAELGIDCKVPETLV